MGLGLGRCMGLGLGRARDSEAEKERERGEKRQENGGYTGLRAAFINVLHGVGFPALPR